MAERIKAMIVSVGGTPAPIIVSLNESRPEYICFFVSKETKKMIEEEIIPQLRYKPRHYDWIVTGDAEVLSECHSKLIQKLPEIMEKWEITPPEVCVDYTGGTKTMSVGLALATIEKSCCYSYVGGSERSKGGVGIVVDEMERKRFFDNPWDRIAFMERREAAILFNKARYTSSADLLERCIGKVSPQQKPYYKALREMILGYELWDRFKHRDAKDKLFRSRDTLLTFSLGTMKKEDKSFVDQLQDNIRFLDTIVAGPKPSRLYFYDLLSNARRRAELENKYDDAVARLYRAMEALGQIELKEKYGIESSDVKEGQIPEPIRQEYVAKYKDETNSIIKIALYASFQLLREKGNEVARNFFELYETEIRPILDVRNKSILAHGFTSVNQDTYKKLIDSIIRFSGAREDDLPRFPVLILGA